MKKFLLLVAAVAALVSCTSDFIQPEAPEQEIPEQGQDAPEVENLQEVLIYANAPKPESDQSEESKTQIVGEGNVQWSPEDKVAICFPINGDNFSWSDYKTYTNYPVEFTSQNLEVSESALFKGEWPVRSYNTSWGAAFYPETITFSSVSTNQQRRAVTTLKYTIPDVQYVEDNSFAKGVNLAYAPVSNADMDANKVNVKFKNLCALIKVVLPQEDYNIKSIKVESTSSNNDGVLHGEAVLGINTTNGTVTINTYPSNKPSLMLQKADGSNLTPGAAYYAVVWPNRSHAGFKFTFQDENGNEAEKFTTEGQTFTPYAGQYLQFNISSLDFDVAPYLTVGATSLSVPARGATNSFFVEANKPVSVSSPSNGWLSVTYDGTQVTAVAAANEGVTERTATITITSAGETKTVTVTQPPVYYKRGAVVDDVRNLNENDSYMIFNTNTNWVETDKCWKLTDGAGNLSATSFNDGKITADQLFKFKKSSSSVASNWKDYSEVIVGSLYSPYNSYYLTTTFRFEGSGSGINFIFASSWGGASSNDIDIWNYNNTNQTLKWSNGLAWGSNDGQGSSARKFYIYKVSVTE